MCASLGLGPFIGMKYTRVKYDDEKKTTNNNSAQTNNECDEENAGDQR